ncbi:hypothetical protein DP130_06825 [Clostridium tetani]|uniref:Uncharacterized protein n=1 Tax=Clostridium tetani TaxID=1513 RepID=A0A4Q0VC36_CLOTA|nr:hypothetical protein [Clostridium tetani]RXI49117.1 hypothetical protein DP130_06825 [Clostridium tetani]
MLSKEVFNKGIEQLVTEFECRGFKMSKERAIEWYKHMKYMDEREFAQKINSVLRTCYRAPVMADILNAEVKFKKKTVL